MKLMLHCCCGPCSLSVASHFLDSGIEVTGWFFNPNIYPAAECKHREDTFRQAAQAIGLPFLVAQERCSCDAILFFHAIAHETGVRCRACYKLRLEATAYKAKENGFDAFSTTLLISPNQDLAAIAEMGKGIGNDLGIEFLFADLRNHYHDSCDRARKLGLYRQNYCGCLFSELERAERRALRAIR